MKSRISLLIAAAMLMLAAFALPSTAAERLKVVTTFTILADMASNVAGGKADVVSIIKPGAEVHQYQPTPKDIVRAQDAGLILRNGLNLELWFEKFLANLSDVPSVTVSDGVEPMSISQGPYSGKPNPHAWMSPENAKIYVDNIASAMAEG
jgi:manganese/iron transport system substrate-binding protein